MIVAEQDGLRLRRVQPSDLDFLAELSAHEEVEPFLAVVRARDRDGLAQEIDRTQREPEEFGRLVIEVEEQREWRRAGVLGYEVANRRSRIAHLRNLAVHPDFRGRRLSDGAARLLQRYLIFDLGYHRLELEIYGFNERAQRHAERAGFAKEGVKRLAYDRHGAWVDGVLYGLVREDLEPGPSPERTHRVVSAGERWAEAYRRAWLAGDAEAAAALYAEDCVFRSSPFRDLEDARAYMRRVLPETETREAWFGTPFEQGDRAAVEYWATLVEPDGTESTLVGCHAMRFDADGLVVEARDYWHLEPGHRSPPDTWGR